MFLMTTGSGLDAATTTSDTQGKFSFGVAKSDTERACLFYLNEHANANVQGATFLAARAIAGGRSTAAVTQEFELDLQAVANWPASDGIEFTTSLAGTDTQNDTVIFGLFLKGTFQSKIALANAPTSNGNQDLDAGFVPTAAVLFSDGRTAHSTMLTTDADGATIGWWGGGNQVAVTNSDNDGFTTSTTRVMQDNAMVIKFEDAANGASPTAQGDGVASNPSGNTLRIAWTNTTATARQFAWLALGSAAGAAATSLLYTPPAPSTLILRP
jgi:hypothetical protein